MFGVLSNDLSKAFHCLYHELLAAKLNAYGVDISTVPFIFDYLSWAWYEKSPLLVQN